jgi:hypothetical protein
VGTYSEAPPFNPNPIIPKLHRNCNIFAENLGRCVSLREIVEQLSNYDFSRQAMLQKATGTDGKPIDEILFKSCFTKGQ